MTRKTETRYKVEGEENVLDKCWFVASEIREKLPPGGLPKHALRELVDIQR